MRPLNLEFNPSFKVHSFLKRLAPCCMLALGLTLTGCSLSEDEQVAAAILSSSEEGVKGCTFLKEIDTRARATIGNARYELKLAASKIGATHVVEMFAYATTYNNLDWELGIALTGRAYLCQNGQGIKQEDPSSYKELPYDMPHPGVNRDDPMTFGPVLPTYIGKPQS